MEFLIVIGLLWLIAAIFGDKTPKAPPSPPVDPALEAERRANQKREDDRFKGALDQWVAHLSAVGSGGRWIPKGTVKRFLAQHPAPKHPRKTYLP